MRWLEDIPGFTALFLAVIPVLIATDLPIWHKKISPISLILLSIPVFVLYSIFFYPFWFFLCFACPLIPLARPEESNTGATWRRSRERGEQRGERERANGVRVDGKAAGSFSTAACWVQKINLFLGVSVLFPEDPLLTFRMVRLTCSWQEMWYCGFSLAIGSSFRFLASFLSSTRTAVERSQIISRKISIFLREKRTFFWLL